MSRAKALYFLVWTFELVNKLQTGTTNGKIFIYTIIGSALKYKSTIEVSKESNEILKIDIKRGNLFCATDNSVQVYSIQQQPVFLLKKVIRVFLRLTGFRPQLLLLGNKKQFSWGIKFYQGLSFSRARSSWLRFIK